jgi:uncharacterized protein (TIGR03086 family)
VSAPAERYRRVAEGFSERVDAVEGDGWDQPSPCEGWTARDVVGHLVEWFPAFLDAADGPTIVIAASVADDPASAWNDLDRQVQALLDDPDVSATTIRHPRAGEHQLDAAVEMFFTGDVLLHTWDLARATGQDETLDDEMVHDMVLGMEPMADALAASGQYGPRVEVPGDADEQTRLLAISGRRA